MNKRAVFYMVPAYLPIAALLQQQHGWEIHGYSRGPARDDSDVKLSACVDLREVMERAKTSPIPEDIISRCERIENEYNLNMADLISPDRSLGIGWMTGGLYPRGRMSYMPHDRHLHIVHEVFTAFSRFIQEVQPSFVCAGVVGSFLGTVPYAVCERFQIPVYALTTAYEPLRYWHGGRYGGNAALERAYQTLKSAPGGSEDLGGRIDGSLPRTAPPTSRNKGRPTDLLGEFLRHSRRHAVGLVRRPKYPSDAGFPTRMKYSFQVFRNYRRDMRRKYRSLKDLQSRSYVYFPLQGEPEATLNGSEPHFTNQLYSVELLSKSVPVGAHVLVKEHPVYIGTRPPGWLDAIAGFPRVELVHPYENPIEIIRGSMATATIAGTSGLQAAIMGRPVISLGPNFRFNFVDHVWFANDLFELRELLKWMYESKDNLDFARDGAILQKAIEMACFRSEERINVLTVRHSQSAVELAYQQLLKKLEEEETWSPARDNPEGRDLLTA